MTEVRLEPMTDAQYATYAGRSVQSYAEEIAGSGSMTLEDATRKATEDFAALLPDGPGTPDHHLFTAYDGDTEIGLLWFRITPRSDGPAAFIFDVFVHPDQRRRGYGRAVMAAADAECRRRGVVTIGLNVFAQNTGARALYEQIGYQVTSLQMRKRL